MKKDAAFRTGIELRRHMFGPPGSDTQIDAVTDVDHDLQEFVTRECFGGIWQRPGLGNDLKSLVTITICVSTGRAHEARVHMIGGMQNGLTPEQIRDAIMHGIMYTGLPPAVEGIRILRELVEAGHGAASEEADV